MFQTRIPGSLSLPPGFIKPIASDSSGVTEIDNSEIRKIANDVLNAAKYSFTSVAANPAQEVRPDTLESTFKEAFRLLKEDRLSSIREKAVQLVKSAQPVREIMFGRYGQLESERYLTIGIERASEALPQLEIDQKLLGAKTSRITLPQGVGRMTPDGLLIPTASLSRSSNFQKAVEEAPRTPVQSEAYNIEKLEEIWGPLYQEELFGASNVDQFEEQGVTDQLGFYITRVKCVDETDLESPGDDTIAIGGVSVDEDGDSKKISEQYVDRGFEDGISKIYIPHWQYHSFNMQEGKYWPKAYKISLFLTEKDWGGFENFLNQVWTSISAKVKSEISKAVAGALSDLLGPATAKAIGDAVAWVVDKLVSWIISWFGDDIFPAFIASCTVPSFSARWNYSNGQWGSPTSPLQTAHFYGHGGHYIVNYYWKIYA